MSYTLSRFDPARHDAAVIAAMHLAIRERQVATGENQFPDVHDSQPDLLAIDRAYLEAGGTFVVATEEATGAILGFAGLVRHDDGHGEIKRVAVDPGHRRRGIGSALIADLVGYADTYGIDPLTLVTSTGERGRRIYRRFGFADVALIPKPGWSGLPDFGMHRDAAHAARDAA